MPKEYILTDVKTHYEPIKCSHCGKNIKHVAYIRQVDSNVMEHVGLTCLKKLLGVNIVFINNNYYEKAIKDNKKIRKTHADIRYYIERKHKGNQIYQTPLSHDTMQIYDKTRGHTVANLRMIDHYEFLFSIRDKAPFISNSFYKIGVDPAHNGDKSMMVVLSTKDGNLCRTFIF